MKRVLLDARQTRQMSAGMKQYVRELTARLPRVAPEFEFVAFTAGGNFGWSEQAALPSAAVRVRAALVHYMSVYVPLVSPARSIVTVHDLIHLVFPHYFKAKVGPYYRTVVRHACARAARVVTDDERTVEDLERFLGVDPKKVRVIPLGVDAARFSHHPQRGERSGSGEVEGSPRRYFLYVGNHRPHKNLQALLDAWRALPADCDVDLALTGPNDFGGALERASNERRRAYALGELSADEIARRYSGAEALVHPALREGFGLPMLEAMAAGTPVVASAQAVPRVLEGSVLSFSPHDVGMLTANLMSVLSDQGLRDRLVNEGRMAARLLTWDRCARATADVYREVVE